MAQKCWQTLIQVDRDFLDHATLYVCKYLFEQVLQGSSEEIKKNLVYRNEAS